MLHKRLAVGRGGIKAPRFVRNRPRISLHAMVWKREGVDWKNLEQDGECAPKFLEYDARAGKMSINSSMGDELPVVNID